MDGSTIAWEAEETVTLVGAVSYGNALLSQNKQLTFATWAGTLVNGATDSFFLYLGAPGGAAILLQNPNFEFEKGSLIFYAPQSAPTFGQLYFETSSAVAGLALQLGL